MTMTATYLETVRENLSDLGGEMTYLKVVVPVQVVYTSKARRCIWLLGKGKRPESLAGGVFRSFRNTSSLQYSVII